MGEFEWMADTTEQLGVLSDGGRDWPACRGHKALPGALWEAMISEAIAEVGVECGISTV